MELRDNCLVHTKVAQTVWDQGLWQNRSDVIKKGGCNRASGHATRSGMHNIAGGKAAAQRRHGSEVRVGEMHVQPPAQRQGIELRVGSGTAPRIARQTRFDSDPRKEKQRSTLVIRARHSVGLAAARPDGRRAGRPAGGRARRGWRADGHRLEPLATGPPAVAKPVVSHSRDQDPHDPREHQQDRGADRLAGFGLWQHCADARRGAGAALLPRAAPPLPRQPDSHSVLNRAQGGAQRGFPRPHLERARLEHLRRAVRA